MTQVNHYGFNQLSQSLHFRKGQYDPSTLKAVDESFLNGDARDVQPGRDYLFDGVDSQLQIIIADKGTLEVSAVKPDGTLDSDISITYDVGLGGYRIEKTVNESVGNIKVWTSTPTTTEKKAVESVQSHLFAWYKGDEGNKAVAFDSSGNGKNADIANASLSTFHRQSDNVYYSWQNNVGYTYDSNNSRYIPRNESNTSQDVQGNSLQYKGKVPYDVYAVNSNCAKFDSGVGNYVDTGDRFDFVHQTGVFEITINVLRLSKTASDTILGSTGGNPSFFLNIRVSLPQLRIYNNNAYQTFTPNTNIKNGWNKIVVIGDGLNIKIFLNGIKRLEESINISLSQNVATNNVQIGSIPASSTPDVLISNTKIIDPNNSSNSEHYPLAEGEGDTIYGVINGKHGTVKNASLSDFWSKTQDQVAYNLGNGFDLWTNNNTGDNLYVPFDSNGNSIKTQGDSIAGYTWQSKHEPAKNFHNGAESRLDTKANDPHFGDYKRATSDTGLHPSQSLGSDDRYYKRDLQNGETDRFTNYLNNQSGKRKTKIENFTQ